jgi:trehalose-phosphatase
MNKSDRQPTAFPFSLFHAQAPAERALLLDYDGTLADFHPERMQARPRSLIRGLLRKLSSTPHLRVAIVSGRPTQELHELLGEDITIELWGAHGWEHWIPGKSLVVWDVSRDNASAFAEAAALARPLVDPHHIEIKSGSVAIHTRALSKDDCRVVAEAVPRVWEPLAHSNELQLLQFDGGFELRDASRTKATAVRELGADLHSGALVAYLGDDATDEDAFAQLGEGDWSILVGKPSRDTNAKYWIEPHTGVARFLSNWIGWSRRSDASN